MDDDVVGLLREHDLLIAADLLAEGLALLPPRTTEYRSGTVRYDWSEREEPVTQPVLLPGALTFPTPAQP